MLVLNRFRVGEAGAEELRAGLERARAALAARAGYVDGTVGRSVDDPSLWVLQTRWADVGSYRRALSSYEVKVTVLPLLSRAIDEPSAYELVEPDRELNAAVPRRSG